MKRMIDVIRTLMFGLIVLYVLGLFAYLALRLFVGEGSWWMGFLNTFARWTFAPAFLLLPLALILRAKRGLLVLLPALAIGVAWYAPDYMPKAHAAVPADAPQIRIVTLNTWGRNIEHARGEGYASIAAWLHSLDADVILLQEVPPVERLRPEGVLGLAELYPSQFMFETHRLTNATLTRLPVRENASYDMARERPSHQRTVVEVNGQPIAIYTIHLHSPFRIQPRYNIPIIGGLTSLPLRFDPHWRNAQIQFLLDALEHEPLPYIVGGDFNLSDQSLLYDRVAAVMTDSFRSAGWGFGTSWRADVEGRGMPPLLRIDYLWHSDDFVTVSSEQGPFLGSDHLPLVSTLALVAEEG